MICRIGRAQLEFGVKGHITEIGIHHGRLFILLALLARTDEKKVAIDLFEHQELNAENSGAGDLALFRENVQRFADPTAMVVYQGDSGDIRGSDVIAMAGGPSRLFSIDGGHTAPITFHDMETAEEALASEGVIISDDCFNEGWPDVSIGLHRFPSTLRRVVPFAIGGNKTFLTTPEAAEKYKSVLLNCGTGMSVREFVGQSVYCFGLDQPSLEQRIVESASYKAIRDIPGIRTIRHAYRALRRYPLKAASLEQRSR
jgi:Methyltransferase domain